MRINRFAGCRKEAKKAISAALRDKHKAEPDIIKPDSIPLFEFGDMGASWGNFSWRTFFEYAFIEEDWARAAEIGIVYEKRFLDVVPAEYRKEMLDELRRLRVEIEDCINDPRYRAGSGCSQEQARVLRGCQNPESLYWAHLAPLAPGVAHVNHDKAVFDKDGNLRPDWNFFDGFIAALEGGVLRTPQPGDWRSQFMYLKKYETEGEIDGSVFGGGYVQVRFHIDVVRLLESRNIFTDPEGFAVPGEYGKTFMVKGGIPIECIDGWSFWEDDGPPPYRKSP